MRIRQGQPLRRETARLTPDSGNALNVCVNATENRVKRARFEPADDRVKTLPPVANPTRPHVTRPHEYDDFTQIQLGNHGDVAGALDRGSRGAAASPVNPPDSPEAHQRIIDTQARLIVASQKQLIEKQNRILRRLARKSEALLYSREPSPVAAPGGARCPPDRSLLQTP